MNHPAIRHGNGFHNVHHLRSKASTDNITCLCTGVHFGQQSHPDRRHASPITQCLLSITPGLWTQLTKLHTQGPCIITKDDSYTQRGTASIFHAPYLDIISTSSNVFSALSTMNFLHFEFETHRFHSITRTCLDRSSCTEIVGVSRLWPEGSTRCGQHVEKATTFI